MQIPSKRFPLIWQPALVWFDMSLFSPIFLFAGLLVGLPILLHLLRRKPRQFVAFPSLRFLDSVVLRESKRHRILRRILLACRCLLLLLLALAFARPFFGHYLEPARQARVVALDNSFSMQADTRWADLTRWAEEQIADLSLKDHCGVLLMNPSPAWLVPLDSSPAAARAAIRQATPGFAETHYARPLRIAAETLSAWPAQDREIIWACDHQRSGWQDVDFSHPLPAGVKIRFPGIPPPPKRQAAITSSKVISTSNGLVLEVNIRQFTPEKDSRVLTISIDGKTVAQQKVMLNTMASATIRIPIKDTYDSPKAMQASLDPDSLPPDDTSYAVTEESDKMSVFLSPVNVPAGETDFIYQALVSAQGENIEAFQVHDWPREKWPLESVAILRNAEPFRPPQLDHLEDFLASGGSAWLMLDGSPEQISWLRSKGVTVEAAKGMGNLQLQGWDTEHPLLEPFAKGNFMPLLSLNFRRGWSLQGPSLSPLATWNDHSLAIAEVTLPQGRLFVTGFDFSRRTSSFSVSSAFVPFVHRAVLWLAGPDKKALPWKVGNRVMLPDESGTWSSIETPQAVLTQTARREIIPEIPGIYRFDSSSGTKFFAINLSGKESDLATWPTPSDWLNLSSKVPAPAVSRSERLSTRVPVSVSPATEISWWLLFAVFILLITEISLANKTAL